MGDRPNPSDEQAHQSREQIRRNVAEADELERFMLKVIGRLPHYMKRCDIKVEAEGSAEWLSRLGRFWWREREVKGLSRPEVATRMGRDVDNVNLLEFGLAEDVELRADFLQGYANALGEPQIFDRFEEIFPNALGVFQRTK